jgi:LuxR family maltose regulon positive regulatory protein
LLYDALSRGVEPDYVRQLLGTFSLDESEQTTSKKSKVDQSGLIEPLSDREIEVLGLLAKGLQRQEIASTLVLSLNTVKTHIRNIYNKLGVNNQMQAVARARALGILEAD